MGVLKIIITECFFVTYGQWVFFQTALLDWFIQGLPAGLLTWFLQGTTVGRLPWFLLLFR